MKQLSLCSLAVFAVATLAAPWAAANQFGNPSFEDPITFEGTSFVGSWEGFSGSNIGGPGNSSNNGSTSPRTGAMEVDLSLGSEQGYAGVFQDVPNLISGNSYNFSGWHKTISSPLNLGVEIRIEWRNAAGTAEVGRTPNLVLVPGSDYSPFSLTAVVPAGAATARAVYAVQSFSTAPLGSGTVLIDDFSFNVPEPAALSLLALGAIGCVGVRRRRK
jgi:hypothetical protein